MRAFILVTTLSLLAVLAACNSQEANRRSGNTTDPLTSKDGSKPASTPQTVQPASLDSARRITVEELHKLWQKDEVLIVDTRTEPVFKQGHIRGSILIPATEFASRADELPKNKMIVTYCT